MYESRIFSTKRKIDWTRKFIGSKLLTIFKIKLILQREAFQKKILCTTLRFNYFHLVRHAGTLKMVYKELKH